MNSSMPRDSANDVLASSTSLSVRPICSRNSRNLLPADSTCVRPYTPQFPSACLLIIDRLCSKGFPEEEGHLPHFAGPWTSRRKSSQCSSKMARKLPPVYPLASNLRQLLLAREIRSTVAIR